MESKYKLTAEWEKHIATWIGWPHNKNDWPGKFEPIPWVFGEMVRKLSFGEKVRILIESDSHRGSAEKILQMANAKMDNIEFFQFNTNRGWTRDSGPIFVKDIQENNILLKFKFNAWAKYNNFQKDAKLPDYIAEELKHESKDVLYNGKKVVLEGGAIDVNGEGSLLTTSECLLSEDVQVRNPGFTRQDYENVFNEYFSVTNVIWLNKGIAGDDTHGHIDDLCRFVNKNTVVLVQEKNAYDDNYRNLCENKEILKGSKLEDGSSIEIINLPMPEPLILDGERLPASYANFYIGNEIVIVPTFNDPNDRIALGILQELFPTRKVCGIHAVDLVWGFGTLHCLTHEQFL